MTPWFKTLLATIVLIVSLFIMVQTVWAGTDDSQEKLPYKMCLVGYTKGQIGCWHGRENKIVAFDVWLKQADPEAIYIKTLVPAGGGIAKVFYKENQ